MTTHACDLSSSDNVVALARDCKGIDILVNNAGAIPQGGIELDEKTWREGWDLKVFGFIALTREVYRDMCAAKRGVIVNVLGNAGERPMPHYVSGSMANAAFFLVGALTANGSWPMTVGVCAIAAMVAAACYFMLRQP